MVFFYFKTATDGFPGLWVRPLPGADKGSSQRRRNRESADRLTGGRADNHVRKEISFPLEKTEKAVCIISLVTQSARSEADKRRRLFLMRWAFAGSNPVSAILEKASCKSMVFFYFKTATDGFPGLWVRPLPGADKGSSQRRRNRESADRLTGGRADDHVRKEISFPLEKTEKAVCIISLVTQSARSEADKRRRLFLMRWAFAGSNPCTPKKTGTPQAALPSKVLDPCTPKKTGTPQAALQSKVLDPLRNS